MDYRKPSVTELIKLLNKPALLNWANRQGLKGIDISVERVKWMNRGTSIHSQIEKYIKTGEPFVKETDQANFEKFFNMVDIHGVENSIETEWFTGKYDILFKYNNRIYLGDFKSNAKKIYFEHKLQLVAYSMAVRCDSFSIISVPSFKMMNFKVDDRSPYEKIIISLSEIYKNKCKIENA